MLCQKCNFWVDCSDEQGVRGFCLRRDLFTYTGTDRCSDFSEGEPMPVEEFDNWGCV